MKYLFLLGIGLFLSNCTNETVTLGTSESSKSKCLRLKKLTHSDDSNYLNQRSEEDPILYLSDSIYQDVYVPPVNPPCNSIACGIQYGPIYPCCCYQYKGYQLTIGSTTERGFTYDAWEIEMPSGASRVFSLDLTGWPPPGTSEVGLYSDILYWYPWELVCYPVIGAAFVFSDDIMGSWTGYRKLTLKTGWKEPGEPIEWCSETCIKEYIVK